MRAFSPFRSSSSLLPLHNSSSSLPPPIIPSPISPSPNDTLTALQRQTTHLQQRIQSLLDAQSAGLLAGLDPSATRPRPDKQYGQNKGVKPTPSLSSARNGILCALEDIVTIRAQESRIISSQSRSLHDTLASIDNALQKRTSIFHSISTIESESQPNLAKLSTEERGLEGEIQNTEVKLLRMRERLKIVRQEKDKLGSRLEARVSSYKGALLDIDTSLRQDYLERPVEGMGVRSGKNGSVWDLPRERRTVEMVRESVEVERKRLERKVGDSEREKEACLQGVEIWGHVVQIVEGVEKHLKREMRKMGGVLQETRQGSSVGGSENGISRDTSRGTSKETSITSEMGDDESEGGMEGVLRHLGSAIGELDAVVKRAEDSGWKLLVCAVGAEVEALREGRELLEQTLIKSGFLHLGSEASMNEDVGEISDERVSLSGLTIRRMSPGLGSGSENDLLGDEVENTAGTRRVNGNDVQISESEDDEPGPELLISHLED